MSKKKIVPCYHALSELDDIQHLASQGVGPSIPKIALFVVPKGWKAINGNFIETIEVKPSVKWDYGFEYYVKYRGVSCRIRELVRGVCCGTDLAIEYPEF